ncbi:MAG TPA: thioredoxin family protein [Bacteroidia bacterium]|nr:thioredoxin family protein [Bacteroidia bacterium]
MIKNIILILILSSQFGFAQTSINTEQNVITGITDVRLLERSVGYKWFKDGYINYQPNNSAVGVLRELPKDIQLYVFAGTWCEKSQQLIPQFYKVADLAGIPKQRITLCFLDRDKRSSQGVENNFGINTTPVFIILQKGVEIGRITESVNQSIEADLADLMPRK